MLGLIFSFNTMSNFLLVKQYFIQLTFWQNQRISAPISVLCSGAINAQFLKMFFFRCGLNTTMPIKLQSLTKEQANIVNEWYFSKLLNVAVINIASG